MIGGGIADGRRAIAVMLAGVDATGRQGAAQAQTAWGRRCHAVHGSRSPPTSTTAAVP
ncbi:MAG TPA: hypothetical protein V6D02_02315 [Candidatus Obscuribacterales bacterium]